MADQGKLCWNCHRFVTCARLCRVRVSGTASSYGPPVQLCGRCRAVKQGSWKYAERVRR